MARKEFIIESEVLEGKNIWTKARVTGEDNIPLMQANVSGYSLQVFDAPSDASETSLYTFSTTSATSVIFNTLQLDSSWRKDAVGYNFKHMVASTAWTQEGGHVYRLEYQLETDDGPLPIIHRVKVLSRHRV